MPKKNTTRTVRYKKNKPTRKCHDCKQPTTNYRCKKCWKKLREKGGYVPASEVVDPSGELILNRGLVAKLSYL